MSYQLIFTQSYERRAARWLKRHPDLKRQYARILSLLEADPFHPSLRLNALHGRLDGLYAVSINLSYRMTLELFIEDQEVVLVNIGSHDAVYRSG